MTQLEEAMARLRNDAERQMNRLHMTYDPYSLEWTVTLGACQGNSPSLEQAAMTVAQEINESRALRHIEKYSSKRKVNRSS